MDHSTVLERLCRVCGRLLVSKSIKTKYACREFLDQLHAVFGISARDDHPNTHPTHFCHACKVVTQKATDTSYQHRTSVFEGWCSHEEGEDECSVCQHLTSMQRGGRPKKIKRTPGRPPSIGTKYCIDRVRQVAPPLLIPPQEHVSVCELHLRLPLTELNCQICEELLSQPIELVTCGSIVCAECICKWLQHQSHLACPCCYSDHLRDFTTIRQAPSLVVTSISSLCVICGQCKSHVQLHKYSDHHKSCTPSTPEVLLNTSVEDIIHQPVSAPLTPIEQKLQTCLARRSVTDENVLMLKTGGKVNIA